MNHNENKNIMIPSGILYDIQSKDETKFFKDSIFKYIYEHPDGTQIPEKYMKDYTTEINYTEQTPLMYSVYINNINYVKILLKYDIGKVDNFNKSALDYAREIGNDLIIELIEPYEYH